MHRNSTSVSTKQQRIAELAKQSQMGFTSLAYLMDIDWLQEAYQRTRKDGAVGVDGQTAAEYEQDLEGNLRSLLERAKSGAYQAPPVRRVYIPKDGATNEMRPIGIPTLEDKVLQRAVVMLLQPIYEQDFLASSYGYRPGRSAHDALEAFWKQAMDSAGCWVLEVDIQNFFESLDHAHLRALLQRRVRDGVLLRLIGKWLKAGVMEDGSICYPESGTPQGGVVSPLFSNVFLHYVLDEWFEREVKPRLVGRAYLIRFADDLVMGFTHEGDARRVLEELPKRFGDHGLTIHPAKTGLVRFPRPPARSHGPAADGTGPGTFDFLGFTHYWGRSRKGNWVVMRKTARSRLTRAIRKIVQWCRQHRHQPLGEQQRTLGQKLRGHFAYYGITCNAQALGQFRYAVGCCWRKWLNRRNRNRTLDWDTFNRLLKRYPLPPVRVVHSVYRRAAKP